MHNIFFILTLLLMIAVVAVLFIGIFGMAKGSSFDRKYGNRLMQARVYLQMAALVSFALALLSFKK